MALSAALVTGATQGIGRATAWALARAGYPVGVCARSPGPVAELVKALRAEGFAAAGQPADVGDPDQVRGLVATVTRELGPVGVLVNNAGIGIFRPFAELTLEDWDATMSTNLRGLFLVTREVLPGMRERKSGFVVNVASLAGKNPLADGTAYAASKHAVLGFTKSLLLEVRKQGVRVMAICPGSVHTAFRGQPRPNAASILQPEDVAASILAALMLPERALMSEIDLRPANP